jgi:hypothetical protein
MTPLRGCIEHLVGLHVAHLARDVAHFLAVAHFEAADTTHH